MTVSPQLRVLRDDVDERVRSIVESAGGWPCRKGCDHCCRHLAELPQATGEEWALIFAEVDRLPSSVRESVEARLEVALQVKARPYVCPFLDQTSGACLVYSQRPIACRTYGFYVERGQGLYCSDIEARAAGGEFDEVVWGNAEAIDARVRQQGELLDLRSALARRA